MEEASCENTDGRVTRGNDSYPSFLPFFFQPSTSEEKLQTHMKGRNGKQTFPPAGRYDGVYRLDDIKCVEFKRKLDHFSGGLEAEVKVRIVPQQ